MNVRITVVDDLVCPKCGAHESHPTNPEWVLIKGFKVCTGDGYWWSHCLVCAEYYDKDLNPTPDNYDGNKGWF